MYKLLLLHILHVICILKWLYRNDRDHDAVKICYIPVLSCDLIRYSHVYKVLYLRINHVHNSASHVVTIKNLISFCVDNLSLLVIYLIILKKIFSYTIVVIFYSLLCSFYRIRKHLMLYLLTLRNAKSFKHVHKLIRAKQPHKIILK